MTREPATEEQEVPAYPIRAYQLIPDPNQPAVVALAIETDQGQPVPGDAADPGRSRQGSAGPRGEDAGRNLANTGRGLTLRAEHGNGLRTLPAEYHRQHQLRAVSGCAPAAAPVARKQ